MLYENNINCIMMSTIGLFLCNTMEPVNNGDQKNR